MNSLDTIAKIVAERVGDRNLERLNEIKRYVQSVVTELTMILRKGSVLTNQTLSVTSGSTSIPSGCFAVLRIALPGGEPFDVVDLKTYRSLESSGSGTRAAFVQEGSPWTINLLNGDSDTYTVKVDYLQTGTDPIMLPDYYIDLITQGAITKYHLNKSTRETYLTHAEEYRRMKNVFKENQAYNDSSMNQVKDLDDIMTESTGASVRSSSYFNIGGAW